MTGQELKQVRTRRGVSQEILEELIGVPDKTVNKLERTNGDIPEHYDKMLRQALRMPPVTHGYKGTRTAFGVRF